MQLIWLCPPVKKAVGGIKVIYRQAELVHQMVSPFGHRSVVMHPNTIWFRAKWFESTVAVERRFFSWRWAGKPSLSRIDGCFDPQTDMVIVPELWARKYGDQLAKMNVRYAIYVQGGYLINKGDPEVLDAAYAGAHCILTISDDTSRCVSMAFPDAYGRILRVHCSVDAQRFIPQSNKENLITFMPRKLADHSSKVLFFLRNHLPAHWRIQPIDGLKEAGVADLLQRSKIFLSFSLFEGFGLPPLEAALSGNQVIGYTGQGAKEYWVPEIFQSVEPGNVVAFAQSILKKIEQLDAMDTFPIHTESIQMLSKRYSLTQEQADMRSFIHFMGLNLV